MKLQDKYNLRYLDKELPEGFKKVDIKIIQERCAEIYRELIDVADEIGVQVFPIYGTLLGHARHDGFIPWDDDIDLVVHKDDVEKLMNALSQKRYGRDYEMHPYLKYVLAWWSDKYDVVTKGTFNSGKYSKYAVDIFTYTSVMKKRHARKIKSATSLEFVRSSKGGGLQKFARTILSVFTINFYRKRIVRLVNKYSVDREKGNYQIIIDDELNPKYISNLLGTKWKRKTFLGKKIDIPSETDKLLTDLYGDWRQLPSEDDQKLNVHFYGEKKTS